MEGRDNLIFQYKTLSFCGASARSLLTVVPYFLQCIVYNIKVKLDCHDEQEEGANVTVNVLHPGLVKTNLINGENHGIFMRGKSNLSPSLWSVYRRVLCRKLIEMLSTDLEPDLLSIASRPNVSDTALMHPFRLPMQVFRKFY